MSSRSLTASFREPTESSWMCNNVPLPRFHTPAKAHEPIPLETSCHSSQHWPRRAQATTAPCLASLGPGITGDQNKLIPQLPSGIYGAMDRYGDAETHGEVATHYRTQSPKCEIIQQKSALDLFLLYLTSDTEPTVHKSSINAKERGGWMDAWMIG